MGIALCVAAFVATLALARRALSLGVAALLTVGYGYGILRANFPDGFSHFMFDASVAGLYLGHFLRRPSPEIRAMSRDAAFWLKALSVVPVLMFFVPLQHPLIQLVGLRAAIYFLPLLVVGARLQERDLARLARWIVVLNTIAVAFGLAEFFLGVEQFYPHNLVTEIIYRSTDAGDERAFRIPATFANAHAFGGAMLGALPLLLGHWSSLARGAHERRLVLLAVSASVTGIFMCGARSPVVLLFILGTYAVVSGGLSARRKLSLAVVASGVMLVVAQSGRFQRFTTLRDADYVQSRIEESANLGLLEIALEYPLGAGLARAGGTSIPFFLAHLTAPTIGLENEYSRIVVEQGLPGLAIWLACIVWTATRAVGRSASWHFGRRIMRASVLLAWATAFIGTGALTAIPGTAVLLLYMGQLATARARVHAQPGRSSGPTPDTEGGGVP